MHCTFRVCVCSQVGAFVRVCECLCVCVCVNVIGRETDSVILGRIHIFHFMYTHTYKQVLRWEHGSVTSRLTNRTTDGHEGL